MSGESGKSSKPTVDPNRKLHIDSNLIKSSSSTLPDELRELGVCAYDESDFQKGVLYQVDVQLAEIELEKASAAAKKHEKSAKKRRSSELEEINEDDDDDDLSRARQDYEIKKARLESHLDKESGAAAACLDEDSCSSNSIAATSFAARVSNDDDKDSQTERMIKMGEMTPFGSECLSLFVNKRLK